MGEVPLGLGQNPAADRSRASLNAASGMVPHFEVTPPPPETAGPPQACEPTNEKPVKAGRFWVEPPACKP